MNAYWAISAVFNPLETATRYLASKVGLGEPMKILQQNLYLWFYTAFIHRLGSYLIDLNSGRLRVGADRYRQLREQMMREAARQESPAEKMAAGPFPTSNGATGHASDRVKQIQVTILGQAKAGKSSLINALLGEQRAKTGVVPTTDGISRYELQTPGIPTRLILLDTVGYASSGPKIDQIKATAEAAKDSDLIFVVLHSRNPGRQADLEMLDGLRKWFESRPEIKAPPIIAVLTHADLLSPSLEWSPPYDWINGTRAKESSMRGAAAATREQLGDRVVSLVPVCTAAGKEWNIETGLIPAVANWLDEIRGVAFLRAIKAEADEGKIVRVFEQAMATGKVVAEQAKTALSKLLTGS
jgi:predicted GTPase